MRRRARTGKRWGARALLVVGALAVVGVVVEVVEDGSSPSGAAPTVPAPTVPARAVPASAVPSSLAQGSPTSLAVTYVTDGDTLELADGRTVRLAQVDAPETNECFGSESTAALHTLTGGATVELRRPVDGPATDKYGRTLAEVSVGGRSANEELVRQGAAEWYEEFAPEDADLAQRLQADEAEARAAGRGLWSACYGLEPAAAPVPIGDLAPASTAEPPTGDCDPAYPTVCLPPAPPDLDCGQIPHQAFDVVVHPDPHGFDGDDDGIGCER